jgi:hypothetical protein
MERVPYSPKTNGNLIRCDLQGFGKIREVSKKLTRVPKIVCCSSRKWPETDVFCEVIKFATGWTEDLPWLCHALNYGWYMDEGPLE